MGADFLNSWASSATGSPQTQALGFPLHCYYVGERIKLERPQRDGEGFVGRCGIQRRVATRCTCPKRYAFPPEWCRVTLRAGRLAVGGVAKHFHRSARADVAVQCDTCAAMPAPHRWSLQQLPRVTFNVLGLYPVETHSQESIDRCLVQL